MNSPAGAKIETLTKVNDFVVKFANVNGSFCKRKHAFC